MQLDGCETSWRAAGFRAIKQTGYVGCVPHEKHPCWDQNKADPLYIPHAKAPKHKPCEAALLRAISAGALLPLTLVQSAQDSIVQCKQLHVCLRVFPGLHVAPSSTLLRPQPEVAAVLVSAQHSSRKFAMPSALQPLALLPALLPSSLLPSALLPSTLLPPALLLSYSRRSVRCTSLGTSDMCSSTSARSMHGVKDGCVSHVARYDFLRYGTRPYHTVIAQDHTLRRALLSRTQPVLYIPQAREHLRPCLPHHHDITTYYTDHVWCLDCLQ